MTKTPSGDLFDPERLRSLWTGDSTSPDACGVPEAGREATPAHEAGLLARLALAFERDLGPSAQKLEPQLARTRELFAALREPAAAAAAQEELPALLDDMEDLFMALELAV